MRLTLQLSLGSAGLFHACEVSEPGDLLVLMFTQQALIVQEAEPRPPPGGCRGLDNRPGPQRLKPAFWTSVCFCCISKQSLGFKG